jgi:hypothetical protein
VARDPGENRGGGDHGGESGFQKAHMAGAVEAYRCGARYGDRRPLARQSGG